jgi:hypothetical protein
MVDEGVPIVLIFSVNQIVPLLFCRAYWICMMPGQERGKLSHKAIVAGEQVNGIR